MITNFARQLWQHTMASAARRAAEAAARTPAPAQQLLLAYLDEALVRGRLEHDTLLAAMTDEDRLLLEAVRRFVHKLWTIPIDPAYPLKSTGVGVRELMAEGEALCPGAPRD